MRVCSTLPYLKRADGCVIDLRAPSACFCSSSISSLFRVVFAVLSPRSPSALPCLYLRRSNYFLRFCPVQYMGRMCVIYCNILNIAEFRRHVLSNILWSWMHKFIVWYAVQKLQNLYERNTSVEKYVLFLGQE